MKKIIKNKREERKFEDMIKKLISERKTALTEYDCNKRNCFELIQKPKRQKTCLSGYFKNVKGLL